MVEVPAGWFSIGCYRLLAIRNLTTYQKPGQEREVDRSNPPGSSLDVQRIRRCVTAHPPGRRWISTFAIDRFEVTRHEFLDCVQAGYCTNSLNSEGGAGYYTYLRILLPAVVNYEDAQAFCRWRGKRLPTDAEWQKAARGTDDRIYPWGDAAPTCNLTDRIDHIRDGLPDRYCNKRPVPGPIGQHPSGVSPYGVHDMLDNAAEWIADQSSVARAAVATKNPDRNFRFSRRVVGGNVILEYDWTSLMFRTVDPQLINPGTHATTTELSDHTKKFFRYGIADSRIVESDAIRPDAGFRCVRSLPGPMPPEVQEPSVGDIVFPFREPGYTPPGTPSNPTNAGDRKNK